MIGRDQNPQIPRRRLRVGLAERVDDARGILAEALRRTLSQSGLVERELLGDRTASPRCGRSR